MNPLLEAIALSMLPIAELRGGIPWAITQGVSPLTAFIFCVAANFLVAPFGYLFLMYANTTLMKIKPYRWLFEHKIEKGREKFEKYVGTKWEFVALVLLVGIPLPFTGAYTGTLLGWFFKVSWKRTVLAVLLGVVLAGLIVTSIMVLGITSLSFFLK